MSLLVFGTIALDDVQTPSGIKTDMLGGSAAHFSMSASLFTKVHLVGVIGYDFPSRHLTLFRKKGIDIESLKKIEGPTFHWKGEYKKDDFNTALTLGTELGVLVKYSPEVTPEQKKIRNVFLANYDPDAQMEMLMRMKKPRLTGLDSMNLWIENKRRSLVKLLSKVDIFILNDGEARALTGEKNIIKSAKILRKMGPRLVVIKKGEHGVLFCSGSFMFAFPAFPVEKVVDPTGAGDTFAGGIMGYLASVKKVDQATLRRAALYATTLSSFNVEGFGVAKTCNLTLSGADKRLKILKKFIAPA